MTALEPITALRICGNHPDMMGRGCKDCPFCIPCGEDNGDSRLMLETADVIEQLMKELAKVRAGC